MRSYICVAYIYIAIQYIHIVCIVYDDWCEHQRFTGDKVKIIWIDMHHKNPIPYIVLLLYSLIRSLFLLFVLFLVQHTYASTTTTTTAAIVAAAPPPRPTTAITKNLLHSPCLSTIKVSGRTKKIHERRKEFHIDLVVLLFIVGTASYHVMYAMSCPFAGKMTCVWIEKLKFTVIIILCKGQSLQLCNQTDWNFFTAYHDWWRVNSSCLRDRQFY